MSITWPNVSLGSITTAQYGLSVATSESGTVPILGMKNLQDGRIVFGNLARVEIASKDVEQYQVHVGDILFNRTNSFDLVGKSSIVEEVTFEPIVFASYLVRLKVDIAKAVPAYVNYVLNAPGSEKRLKDMATPGVSQFNINPTALRKHFQISLPTLSEQKAIVAVLGCWDRGIRQLADLVATKLRFKQGLMQQLLTGNRRFKELESDPWSDYHLGDLFAERDEINCLDLPLLSITADRGVIPRADVDRKDTSNDNKSLYKRIVPGDIGYNTMRMWQGVSAVSRHEGIVSPAYTICIPGPKIDADFAGYLFKYPPVVHLFYRFSQGLVNDTLNLKFHHFAQVRVRIPSVKEQKKIAQVFSKLDDELDVLRKQLEALKKQKKGLMQKLLSGAHCVIGVNNA